MLDISSVQTNPWVRELIPLRQKGRVYFLFHGDIISNIFDSKKQYISNITITFFAS